MRAALLLAWAVAALLGGCGDDSASTETENQLGRDLQLIASNAKLETTPAAATEPDTTSSVPDSNGCFTLPLGPDTLVEAGLTSITTTLPVAGQAVPSICLDTATGAITAQYRQITHQHGVDAGYTLTQHDTVDIWMDPLGLTLGITSEGSRARDEFDQLHHFTGTIRYEGDPFSEAMVQVESPIHVQVAFLARAYHAEFDMIMIGDSVVPDTTDLLDSQARKVGSLEFTSDTLWVRDLEGNIILQQ